MGVKIENREGWDKLDRRGERNNNERKEKGNERIGEKWGERQKWVYEKGEQGEGEREDKIEEKRGRMKMKHSMGGERMRRRKGKVDGRAGERR